MKGNTKTLFYAAACLFLACTACHAQQSAYTPKPGSAEREAIMDVMRLDFYRNNPALAHKNPDRVFERVLFLKVHGDWALTCVLPVDAANKGIAEPRWGLLHRKSGRWLDVDYFDALGAFPSQKTADDADDMTDSTVRKLWRAFPEAPRDIFPDAQSRKEIDAKSRQ